LATRCSFCGSTSGPFSKVEGLLTVLMCADCQAARGHGSGPYPVMTRAEMRAGLELLPTWVLEQKAAANRQVIAVMRQRLAAGEQVVRIYQEPGLAWLVLAWRSPPRFRRCRTVLPEEASIGAAPHSIEKAAPERSRAGSSPAVTSSAPATSAPTPQLRNAGAARAVSRSSSAASVVSSAVSANCRSATVRSASLVARSASRSPLGAAPQGR
jgi:hypothetical protein